MGNKNVSTEAKKVSYRICKAVIVGMNCPTCGAVVHKNAPVCLSCNQKLDWSPDVVR